MIYAHVVGLMMMDKSSFKKQITSFVIVDLDELGDSVMDDEKMRKLLDSQDKCDKEAQKLKVNAHLISESKELGKKINEYWKLKMKLLIEEYERRSDKIVMIGYCNFYKNIKTFVDIKAKLKVFIHIDKDVYTKQSIRYCLDTYRDEIIDGHFDLKLLNPDELIKKRIAIKSMYNKKGYDNVDMTKTVELLKTQIVECPVRLYYGSPSLNKTKINGGISAYTEEWIALVNALKSKDLVGGYDHNNQPYVRGRIELLKQPLYMHLILDTTTFMPVYVGEYLYKYKTCQSVKVHNSMLVENIYHRLKELGCSLINV
jgi:hypothetical protein